MEPVVVADRLEHFPPGSDEHHFSPAVGQVHVDGALRAPYPVVLRVFLFFRIQAFSERYTVRWDAAIPAIYDFVRPLHAGEVDAPNVTGLWRRVAAGIVSGEFAPWERDFHGPGFIHI